MPPHREFLLTFRSCLTTVWCQNMPSVVGRDSSFIFRTVEEECTLPLGVAFRGMVPSIESRSACVPGLLDLWPISKNNNNKHLSLTCHLLKSLWGHRAHILLYAERAPGRGAVSWGRGEERGHGSVSRQHVTSRPATPCRESTWRERPSTPNLSQLAAHTRSR